MDEILNINGGKKDGEERDLVANQKEPCHTSHVGPVCHTGAEEVSDRVPHVLHTWPPSLVVGQSYSSRASLTFFGHIRASKLRLQIRLKFKNLNFLTHNDDYKTLTKG